LIGIHYRFNRCFVACALGLITVNVQAASLALEDWVFNIDGGMHEAFFGDPLPATGELIDGKGTLSLEINGSGVHSVIGFFDFEIDQYSNTFFNESGAAVGMPRLGQSWEIDEPKYFFGDILDNVSLGTLDNTNAVPSGQEDDVGFALGWDFDLLLGQTAVIDFIFDDNLPTVDFFLSQTDLNSDFSIYFYSTLSISGGSATYNPNPITPVTEPSTLILAFAGGGVGMLFSSRRRKRMKIRIIESR